MGGLSIPSPGSSASRHRKGRARRLKSRAFGLQITSLMDILMIIVVFLLKSYGLSSMNIVQTDKLELPQSKSVDTFGEGIVLIVAQDKVYVDGEEVLTFEGEAEERKFQIPEGSMDPVGGRGILPIYDILARKKEEFDTLAARSEHPDEATKKWTGELLVQADKAVNYELLRQVMYTAGMAGYKQFRLTVEKFPE
ncbi:MAG: biopolymer transporter ExbD [Oligoflexia bacterium]|nr:biopolymer transporter ExbD [Oligoflexia bacterium]